MKPPHSISSKPGTPVLQRFEAATSTSCEQIRAYRYMLIAGQLPEVLRPLL
jgi:hypothetical protein